jgi:hypothetical protein
MTALASVRTFAGASPCRIAQSVSRKGAMLAGMRQPGRLTNVVLKRLLESAVIGPRGLDRATRSVFSDVARSSPPVGIQGRRATALDQRDISPVTITFRLPNGVELQRRRTTVH